MEDWLITAVEEMGIVGVGLLMFLENVFPPLPSEVIMPLAGYLSAQGAMNFWAAVAAGAIGSLLGACLWYAAGRAVRPDRFRAWITHHGAFLAMTVEDLDTAEQWFRRNGRPSVLFGRLVPVVRTLISVPAGFTRLPFPLFLFYTSLGTAVWTGLLAFGGRILGQSFNRIDAILGMVTWVIIAFVLIAYVVRVSRLVRNGRASFFGRG